MAVSRREQRAGSVDRGGQAQGDAGEIAEIGRGQRTLPERGEDHRRVIAAGAELRDRLHLARGVEGKAAPRVHPGRVVDDDLVDVRVQPSRLRADWTRQQRDRGVWQRLPDSVDGRRRDQHIAEVVETDGQHSPRVPPFAVHRALVRPFAGRSRSLRNDLRHRYAAVAVATMRSISAVVLRPATSDRISTSAPTSCTASISGRNSAR